FRHGHAYPCPARRRRDIHRAPAEPPHAIRRLPDRRARRNRDRGRRRAGPEGLTMATATEIARQAQNEEIRSRWLLSTPALVIIFVAAVGPLFVMLAYSFMVKGDYGDVKFGQFSLDGWFSVLLQRDIFDDTIGLADAHLSILWRSIRLSFITTVATLLLGFPTAYFIATRPRHTREIWVFLVT